MKILHLIDSGGLYGAEKMLLALMQQQKANNIESMMLSCGKVNEPEKALETEAKKQKLNTIAWRMKHGFNFRGMMQILGWAKENEITHLHSHGYKFNVLIGLIPKAFRKQFKWVVTVHGFIPAKPYSKDHLYQFLDKKMSRLADKLCLVSPAMMSLPDFQGIRNSEVIFNGIDQKAEANRTRTNTSNVKKLVSVGRLSHEKGIKFLLESLANLKRQGTEVHLTLMGEGGLKDELHQLAEQLGLSDQVTFKGFVDNPAKHFANYDAIVMPSLTEGIPITLLEAMREKLIIIASRVGGIPYLLGEEYPYLVDAGNTEALTAALTDWANHVPEDLSKLAERNYLAFKHNFTAQKMYEKYQDIYLNA